MKADAETGRKGERELALDEAGLEAARRDLEGGAMTPAPGRWRDDVVALLHSRTGPP